MLYDVFIWFLAQENIGLDPKIMILHEEISEILEIWDTGRVGSNFEIRITSEFQLFFW